MLKGISNIQKISRGLVALGGNGYVPSSVMEKWQKELSETKQKINSVSGAEKTK